MIRVLLVLAVCGLLPLAGQDPRGTVVGRVTDSTGAVVAAATVRAQNLETGVVVTSASNDEGQYEIPYLLPGKYTLSAEMAGFKRWRRAEIELRTGDRLQLDIQLEVGDITEAVEVTAAAPILESATSTVSQVMSSQEAASLPQRGGSLAWIYALAPAVIVPNLPAGGPWNIDQSSAFSVAGSGNRGLDFSVDGVTNNSYGGNTAFTPPPDMVQEVRVQTATYDASIGHTTGGSLSISLKSGTNHLHGSAAGLAAWGPLLTRNFFINQFIFDPRTGPVTDEKIKANTPEENWKRYSIAVGGPIYLPKLYNGRNRTFWMFGYQQHNRAQPVAQLVSVPTLAQRKGDFSALLSLGPQYQIYDPFSSTAQGTRIRRNPLAGNIVPASRIHPVGQKMVNYYPAPNATGTADELNNYSVGTPKNQDLYQPVVRIDHNFSKNHRMFGRYSHSDFTGTFDKYDPKTTVRGRSRIRDHRGAALDDVIVLTPQMIVDVRYGFTWFNEGQAFDNQGWNLSEFGFPQSLLSQLNPEGITFPAVSSRGMLTLGNDGGFDRRYYTHSILGTVNWVKGNHSLKFGSDLRLIFENDKTFGNVSPQLTFNETYTRGPLDNSPAAPVGQGIASMLFGLPDGGRVDVNDSRAEHTRFLGLFVQDDWRLSTKLTVNLGLRWEYESPVTERFNRGTRGFDFVTVNPIQAEARAAYARSPIPEIQPAQFNTIGGVTFLGVGGNPRGLRDPDYRAIMPRIGVAYQFTPRTVLRAGYGIFFDMLGSEFTDIGQPGFSQATSVVASTDGGLSFVGSISNPLPFGLVLPQGAKGGLKTFLGRSPGFYSEDGRRPYVQRWSGNVQFQPLSRSVVEVGYIGSKVVRSRATVNFNSLPAAYLSTLGVRDQAVINYLTARVTNPFLGIDGFQGSSLATATTVNRSQLLLPYPHFGGLSTGLPAGSSWYNALTARFERRMTAGLQFRLSYTWSKNIEAVNYRNPTDRIPEHVVANLDRPHRLVVSSVYELPFGRGKRLLGGAAGLVNHVVGGWQVQAIAQFQSGPPLNWGNVIFTGQSWNDIKLPKSERSLERWFNTSVFDRNPQNQLANNLIAFPSRISALRADGINLWDVSLFKNFRVREGVTLQLRAESENIANHPMFNPPNTDPVSSNFGKVTGTQEGEGARRVFLGLKIIF